MHTKNSSVRVKNKVEKQIGIGVFTFCNIYIMLYNHRQDESAFMRCWVKTEAFV